MRMYDLILKKRNGAELEAEELKWFADGCAGGTIPDYQISAMLMAVYFQGMSDREITEFTVAMADSGDRVDLSSITGVKVDKHSTGGVGDKTTVVAMPIAAACGLKVAKMSGRGLGYTGGTVDKLESIPGFKTSLSAEEFLKNVEQVGICVTGQSGNLAPADKKLYALRDVTATIDSLPLIASSIMSKKLAAGADVILLDVKYGSGSLMGSKEMAEKLAEEMVSIGELAGRKTAALLTNMDIPLGNNIGNSLEIAEAVQTLRGQGPSDLLEVSLDIAAGLLHMSGAGDWKKCRETAVNTVKTGAALEKLCQMVERQGGDVRYIDEPSLFESAAYCEPVLSPCDGYIWHMDTDEIGMISVSLGAGREVADEKIDHSAGIVICRKTGDAVKAGEAVAYLHTNCSEVLDQAKSRYERALTFARERPEKEPLIYAYITKEGVKYR